MKPAITLTSLDYARLDRVVHLAQAQGQDVAGLESELLRADIVEPRSVRPDVVTMNSRVRFTFEPEAEEFEYVLSYPWDADKTDVPRLSVLTPVGSALLGLRVGQRIDWQVPGGRKLRLHVIELPWQPESNGEEIGD
ncbi:nucleoside diphosphate kinase regulator [Uliginosibacterium sp. H1]|uniref:nucleoside diphosphate kinase regulator n=1 Tax=Uliginosibacterium sp. H1 TaxID=3114757 RepID=UPI002E18348D|nr:nucleoside diphosphate kinase regulator [Uliginosibacterium sp. H1]